MKKIRLVQIGCGKMSKYTMRFAYEHGCEIAGAFDVNPYVIGCSIREITKLDGMPDVYIKNIDELDSFLSKNKIDIAIITTMSLLNDIKNILRIVVKNKVNAITTCEEAFYGKNSNKLVYDEINTLAMASGVTVFGCGYQDVFWGNLIDCIAGSTNQIMKIKGKSSYNVEDYGIALAKAHGAGLTKEEFTKDIASQDEMSYEERKKRIEEGTFSPSYMWNTVGWLADKLHLEITSINQKCVPIMCDEDMESTTLNMKLKKGMVRGMSAVVTATTSQKVTIEAECQGFVYKTTEFDSNEWSIQGEPSTTVVVNRPDTVLLTCADIVNRIPDCINAKPGFISTSSLNSPKYHLESFENLIK